MWRKMKSSEYLPPLFLPAPTLSLVVKAEKEAPKGPEGKGKATENVGSQYGWPAMRQLLGFPQEWLTNSPSSSQDHSGYHSLCGSLAGWPASYYKTFRRRLAAYLVQASVLARVPLHENSSLVVFDPGPGPYAEAPDCAISVTVALWALPGTGRPNKQVRVHLRAKRTPLLGLSLLSVAHEQRIKQLKPNGTIGGKSEPPETEKVATVTVMTFTCEHMWATFCWSIREYNSLKL